MRISDWSSDVCSSDLLRQRAFKATAARLQEAVETHDAKADRAFAAGAIFGAGHLRRGAVDIILQHIVEEAHDIREKLFVAIQLIPCFKVEGGRVADRRAGIGIGRAGCRERGCQYGKISGDAGTLKKKIRKNDKNVGT